MGAIGDVNAMQNVIDFEWQIKDFFSLSQRDSIMYWSPAFSFCERSWYLGMYPNGALYNKSGGYIGLCLIFRSYSDPPIEVKYSIAIKTVKGKKDHERHCTTSETFDRISLRGFPQFIARSELLKRKAELVPSGVLTVVCTLEKPLSTESSIGNEDFEEIHNDISAGPSFQTEEETVGNEDFEERHNDISAGPSSQTEEEMGIGSLNQDFKEVFLNGNISDVVLKVKDQESSAHKCILATRSPSFMTVILHDTKEEVTPVVNIQDVDRNIFPDFINYLFTGRVENLTSESALKLFVIADKYQITKLKKTCVHHMLTNISIDNFCDAYILSLRHDEVYLEKACIQFFAQNSFDIILTAKWQSFLCENPVIGNELFIKHMQLNK